jgi:large subunit ribosomal protein L18
VIVTKLKFEQFKRCFQKLTLYSLLLIIIIEEREMIRKMLDKNRKRLKRKIHIRKTIFGVPEKPRLTVTRSNRRLSMQVVDDIKRHTIVAVSTLENNLRSIKPTVDGGVQLGEIMGKRLLEQNIQTVVFDRNGYLYHGVVKAMADGVRKAGVRF